MLFPSPLQQGLLKKRYKRFLADITLDTGEEITAHCPNPGSMMGVAPANAPAWVSLSPSKTRKLPHTLELVKVDGGLVAINTNNPNKIGAEAITNGLIPELTGYKEIQREVKYGENSRIDILLSGGRRKKPAYVEIKNVHLMREKGLAEFPDSVTARGAKHLRELSEMRANGYRAIMLFIVQRMDCKQFTTAVDLDPTYAQSLLEAIKAGVEVLCYDCEITTNEVRLRKPLAVRVP
ncbi:MAG: DNA/RNA nuclease SfsA [Pseudomonadota bacterium]